MQSMTFPSLWYLGRYSPFESPPPPQFEKHTEPENKTRLVGFRYLKNVALLAYNLFALIFFLVCPLSFRKKKKIESSPQDKAETPPSFNPSPWRPRKKGTSYCECCHQSFSNLEEVEILMVAFVLHATNSFFVVCFNYILNLLCLLVLAALTVRSAPCFRAGSLQLLCCRPTCG